ncbi:MAG TPA: hypothetical protein VGP43_11460 [Chitinophagaceae bacterium]|nr:hypothetical protein [Chitinophagaceae bacterium]
MPYEASIHHSTPNKNWPVHLKVAYWDKTKEKWPRKPDGSIEMYTQSLDLNDLLREWNEAIIERSIRLS